jgi:hypothetical protein
MSIFLMDKTRVVGGCQTFVLAAPRWCWWTPRVLVDKDMTTTGKMGYLIVSVVELLSSSLQFVGPLYS